MSRNCPICNSEASEGEEFLPENIDPSKVSSYSFASRKTPEYMSNHMVKCKGCDLVFADSPPSQADLATAYHDASYDSSDEADDAASAYVKAFYEQLTGENRDKSALEIGTGTGVFLEALNELNFGKLVGIEPSTAAIEAAPKHRRAWILEGIFDEGDFAPESFDVIACFMTLEHVRDPQVIAAAAYRLLKPGGVFLSVTHDYRHFVNRSLGRRSPIVDIEHMQLFNGTSVTLLFKLQGFTQVTAKSFRNRYSISYWAKLFPFTAPFKRVVLAFLDISRIGRIKLSMNVGNTATVAVKPQAL